MIHIAQYSKIKYIIIHYIDRYSKVLFTFNLHFTTLQCEMCCMSAHYNVQYSVIHYNTFTSTHYNKYIIVQWNTIIQIQ